MFIQELTKNQDHKHLPLGIRVIDERLKNAGVDGNENVELYFDNFYSTYNTMVFLKERNIKATGTVRKDRIGKCPKVTTFHDRGDFDYQKVTTLYVCHGLTTSLSFCSQILTVFILCKVFNVITGNKGNEYPFPLRD